MTARALGSMAWVLSARGIYHRATLIGGGQWELACRPTSIMVDVKAHATDGRPRDEHICKVCRRNLGAKLPNVRQATLFDPGVLDGRK